MTDSSPIFVVLGRDAQGKPHAARFPDADAERAAKAADLMGYRAVRVEEPPLRGLAANLPLGKVYATGRAFVPFVGPAVFDKLASLIEADESTASAAGEAAAAPKPDASPASAAPEPKPATSDGPRPRFMPRNWDEIGPGSVVLAHYEPAGSWWEAVVYLDMGDSFRLTWRDSANEPAIVRRRD